MQKWFTPAAGGDDVINQQTTSSSSSSSLLTDWNAYAATRSSENSTTSLLPGFGIESAVRSANDTFSALSARLLQGLMQHHEEIAEYFIRRGVSAEILARYKLIVDATLLIPNLMKIEDMVTKSLEYFRSTQHIALYYEDIIKNRTKLTDVQDFLRVPRMEIYSSQVKIHKGPVSSLLENWADVENTLRGTAAIDGKFHQSFIFFTWS